MRNTMLHPVEVLSQIGRVVRGVRSRLAVTTACAVFACWATTASAEAPKVVVTIKPLHSIVAAVMEGAGTPSLLLDGVQSPHSFALKPSQARDLNAADFVFLADMDLEVPIARIAKSLPEGVRVVALSKAPGVSRFDLRTGVAFEPHTHDGGDAGGHGHAHDDHAHGDHKGHGHDDHAHDDHKGHKHDDHAHDDHKGHGHDDHAHGDHEGHAHGNFDPHFWLDPRNARAAASHVADLLAKRFPEHTDVFAANVARLDKQLDELESRLEKDLADVREAGFLVFHDAFQYFERRFGLKAVGSITANPEVLPGARRLAELRQRVRDSGAVCVFSEPQFQARVIDTVVEGTGVRKGVVDPLGSGVEAGPGHYARMLEEISGALKGCLAS